LEAYWNHDSESEQIVDEGCGFRKKNKIKNIRRRD